MIPGDATGSGGNNGQSLRMSGSRFWIALISFVNMCYSIGAMTEYCVEVTRQYDYSSLVKGAGFVLAAAGVFPIPLLFKHIGIFDDDSRFRRLFTILSALGIASIVLFASLGSRPATAGMGLLLVLQFISMLIPAITTGCALQRAVKAMGEKQTVMLSGLSVIIAYVLTAAHMLLILFIGALNDGTEMTRVSQYGKGVAAVAEETLGIGLPQYGISFIALYSAMLIIPVILLLAKKDAFEHTGAKDTAYFSEPLFRKFIILAIIMAALDAFHDSSYYSGGSLNDYSLLFTYALMLLPIVFSCVIVVFLRKNKWMLIMLICVLSLCFQQGLNLFFSDRGRLAIVYELVDTVSGSGPPIFLLFIPLMYCVQRRSNATAAAGIAALWFFAGAVSYFLSPGQASELSITAAPAAGFVVSFAAIAFLFYLNGEHNRLYYRTIIEEYRSRLKNGELSTDEAIQEAGLSEAEQKVVLLLMEGETRRDISRRLNLSAAEVNNLIAAIRDKLVHLEDPDPLIAAATKKFNLTRRETTMLRCLREGMTNQKIAEELFISEGTVKIHVHNLLKKLNVERRQQLAAWEESFLVGREPQASEEKVVEI